MDTTVLLFIGLGIIGVGICEYFHLKRSEDFQAAAEELGLEFSKRVDRDTLDQLAILPLFSRGDNRRSKNCIHGQTDDTQIRILDYSFTTGCGKQMRVHAQTVVVFTSAELALPSFQIARHTLLERVGRATGLAALGAVSPSPHSDVRHRFADSSVLCGQDLHGMEAFFDDQLINFFAERKGMLVEGGAFQLVCYHPDRTTRPANLRALFEEAFTVFSNLRRRSRELAEGGALEHVGAGAVATEYVGGSVDQALE